MGAVLVEGVEQVAVFVCAVLGAGCDQAVGFLRGEPEVFHQGSGRPAAFPDLILEGVPQHEGRSGCRLQLLAHESAVLLHHSQTVGHVLEVVAEALGIDALDGFAEGFQLCAGRTRRRREVVHRGVPVVPEICEVLPGLDDRLARCDCDAAHRGADGCGLPVDLVEVAGDVVQRLPERRVDGAGEAHDGLKHFIFPGHVRHLLRIFRPL